jgi:hypothetical protein
VKFILLPETQPLHSVVPRTLLAFPRVVQSQVAALAADNMPFVDRNQAGEFIGRLALASGSPLLLAEQRELSGDEVRGQYKHQTARAVPLLLTIFRPKHQGQHDFHPRPETSSPRADRELRSRDRSNRAPGSMRLVSSGIRPQICRTVDEPAVVVLGTRYQIAFRQSVDELWF